MDWFCTFTFAVPPHPESATKKFNYWLNELNKELYGKAYKKFPEKGVYWVLALEYHKSGVLHFHALLGDIKDLNTSVLRLKYMDLWKELAGFCKIEKIENDDLVRNYISKYTSKGGEIDLSENMRNYAVQVTTCLQAPRL